MEFVGIGTLSRKLGISTAALRYALLNGRVPDGSIRAPTGARLFDEDAAEAVIRAYESRSRRRALSELQKGGR